MKANETDNKVGLLLGSFQFFCTFRHKHENRLPVSNGKYSYIYTFIFEWVSWLSNSPAVPLANWPAARQTLHKRIVNTASGRWVELKLCQMRFPVSNFGIDPRLRTKESSGSRTPAHIEWQFAMNLLNCTSLWFCSLFWSGPADGATRGAPCVHLLACFVFYFICNKLGFIICPMLMLRDSWCSADDNHVLLCELPKIRTKLNSVSTLQ